MKALGNKVRESLVEAGCVVDEMRVNEEKRRIEGKVTYGRDSLYLRFSPDLPCVWDGVLSSDKERGAFAWGDSYSRDATFVGSRTGQLCRLGDVMRIHGEEMYPVWLPEEGDGDEVVME